MNSLKLNINVCTQVNMLPAVLFGGAGTFILCVVISGFLKPVVAKFSSAVNDQTFVFLCATEQSST